MSYHIGRLIYQERRRREMPQKDMAILLDISPQYLNDIESGKRAPTTYTLLQRIADRLQIPVDIVYFYAGKLPPDIAAGDYNADQIIKGFAAFRKVLK